MRLYRTAISIISVCTIFFTHISFADPIYRTTDKNGIPSYSSKPKDAKSEVAKLPNITREKMGNLKVSTLTCVGHGGINCQLGADSDGSVICYDNFKDSIQRFAVSCSAAKLVIIPESYKVGISDFSLVIRNSSAVPAKGIKVSTSQGMILEGLTELEPYGSSEYFFKKSLSKDEKFQVSCDNCP